MSSFVKNSAKLAVLEAAFLAGTAHAQPVNVQALVDNDKFQRLALEGAKRSAELAGGIAGGVALFVGIGLAVEMRKKKADCGRGGLVD
ncbi:MAG: hypothetical protein PW734_12420 [Verrucomicrobium sp.]|nr:hypothetical protein [Verrucomicrobium sp.]